MRNQSSHLLEKSILATLCYFDVFDYPLTFTEIWKWLYNDTRVRALGEEQTKGAPGIVEVQETLENSYYLQEKIETKGGYYFLKGREKIIEIRKARYNIAEKKYKKVMRIVRILRFFPFLKMIAVCNTLATSNSRKNADIDLFIITQRNRVWQSRFWVAGFLKIFGLRPSSVKVRDAFCTSFFVDEDNLNLEHLAIENDVYLPYWISQVFPINDEGVYERFVVANQWIKKSLPNFLPVLVTNRRRQKSVRIGKRMLEMVGRFLPETIFKNYQLKIMPAKLKALTNKDKRVVAQDGILKFHDNDRRELFLNLFRERLAMVMDE